MVLGELTFLWFYKRKESEIYRGKQDYSFHDPSKLVINQCVFINDYSK
jgi:hypothetical protein